MLKAVIAAYELPDESRIELCVQRNGTHKWAVRRGCACLNSDGEFEFEPTPSGRDDDFLTRCRFESAEAAYQAWESLTF